MTAKFIGTAVTMCKLLYMYIDVFTLQILELVSINSSTCNTMFKRTADIMYVIL